MALIQTILFVLCTVGRGADDHAELLQVRWDGTSAADSTRLPTDFLVTHYNLIKQELSDLTEAAKKANATKKKEAATKGVSTLQKKPRKAKAPMAMPDLSNMGEQVRIMTKGLDLIAPCMHQVRKDQDVMLRQITRIQTRNFDPVVGKDGLDALTADEDTLKAAATPLMALLGKYKEGFQNIIANEKPLGKKVENYYETGRGHSVKAQVQSMVQPLTEEALDASLQAWLVPLGNATDALSQLSNVTSLKDRRAAFKDVGKLLHSAARITHRHLDPTIAADDAGTVKKQFDQVKAQAQFLVGPQIFNKVWSVIRVSMLNAHTQVEIFDKLSALIKDHSDHSKAGDKTKAKGAAETSAKGKKAPSAPAQHTAAKGKKAAPASQKAAAVRSAAMKGKKAAIMAKGKKGAR